MKPTDTLLYGIPSWHAILFGKPKMFGSSQKRVILYIRWHLWLWGYDRYLNSDPPAPRYVSALGLGPFHLIFIDWRIK